MRVGVLTCSHINCSVGGSVDIYCCFYCFIVISTSRNVLNSVITLDYNILIWNVWQHFCGSSKSQEWTELSRWQHCFSQKANSCISQNASISPLRPGNPGGTPRPAALWWLRQKKQKQRDEDLMLMNPLLEIMRIWGVWVSLFSLDSSLSADGSSEVEIRGNWTV